MVINYAADGQFEEKANTTIVGLEVEDVKEFLSYPIGLNGNCKFWILGNRLMKSSQFLDIIASQVGSIRSLSNENSFNRR